MSRLHCAPLGQKSMHIRFLNRIVKNEMIKIIIITIIIIVIMMMMTKSKFIDKKLYLHTYTHSYWFTV